MKYILLILSIGLASCGAQQDKIISPAKAKKLLKNSDTLVADSLIILEDQAEMDSIDEFHRYWYEVLDTNGDGDIDYDTIK